MIYGIGNDCVDIGRMEKLIKKEHFMHRVFTQDERKLFAQRGAKTAQSAAACFAAKEAFLKACGKGIFSFSFTDMAALRKESGAPYFQLSGMAEHFCKENGLCVHLSLTHEKGLAFAFVVLERTEN